MNDINNIKTLLAELSARIESYEQESQEPNDAVTYDLRSRIKSELRQRLFYTRIYTRQEPRRVVLHSYFLGANGQKADMQMIAWSIPDAETADDLWPEIKRTALNIDAGIRKIVECLIDNKVV